MTKPRLIYFDAPASRGEECRLAMHVGGMQFEDVRIKPTEWPTLKPGTPFGSVPILEIAGKPPLAQSNAILVYIGRETGLLPSDNFEAARHLALMCHVEDLRGAIGPTLFLPDAEKKRAREALLQPFLPSWAANAEKHIGAEGPFFAGAKMHVADIKLFMAVRWLASGKVDHIPADVFAAYPKLNRVHDAVRDDARIKAWYARS